MIIVDQDINRLIEDGHLKILTADADYPFDPQLQIGPGSIDLRLGFIVRRYKRGIQIDLSTTDDTELVYLRPNEDFIIEPRELWLAHTLETVMIPPFIAALITGRSSFARLGLLVQCSQDYIQPGYAEPIPLQLVNVTDKTIKIQPGLRICQIALMSTTSSAAIPYFRRVDAKYVGEHYAPEPSKIGVELGLDKPEDLKSSPEEIVSIVNVDPIVEGPEVLAEAAETQKRLDELASDFERQTSAWQARIENLEHQNQSHEFEDSSLGSFIRQYACSPEAVEEASRSSFREDTVIREISRFLSDHPHGTIHILDACCGQATLPKQLIKSISDRVGRIAYCGIDHNPNYIRSVEIEMRAAKQRFESFHCIAREISDLEGLPGYPFDLIVLSNTLHEISPATYPTMFTQLNSLLNPARGQVCIIDMENLPAEEPEAVAITWHGDEVVKFLKAGGLKASLSQHPKRVMVYQVDIKHTADEIDESAMTAEIHAILNAKMVQAIDQRQEAQVSLVSKKADFRKWLVLTGTIARCAEEITALANSFNTN